MTNSSEPKKKKKAAAVDAGGLLKLKPEADQKGAVESQVHLLKEGIICTTDYRAQKRDPLELVLHATDGFIPLWAENVVLRWRFDETSLAPFEDPEGIKQSIRDLLTRAILAWGDAAPVRFDENEDNSDFWIVVEALPKCSMMGCTLARAFFPDSGRHRLTIYPTMFTQSDKEQVDTMTHEIGHVFGLRHFFAPEMEGWPSVIYGTHEPMSIMNYGHLSELTEADKRDLKTLYQGVWSGGITQINKTPVRLVKPFHALGS